MENKIRNIGTVQHLDEEGFIINNLSLDSIQEEYKIIIDETLAFYKTHFKENLHSIYLRGSVAKGEAIPHISDLDTFAITYSKVSKKELMNRIAFWEEMSVKYPYLNGIEIHFESIDKIMSSERAQFLLQTQCICIYGKDLRIELPKFGIGEWAYAHSNDIQKGVDEVKAWLKEEHTEKELKEVCSWIMKRMVRIGFELVMEKEQCFTRDLYPCYELFSKNYPNKDKEMREALKLAVFPTSDMDDMWKVIYSLHGFLIEEARKRKGEN